MKQLGTPSFHQLADSFLLRVPLSNNNTYTFIPRDFLQGFAGVNGTVQLPSLSTNPGYSDINPRDIPSNIDPSTISYACEFLPTSPAFFVSNLHAKVGFPDNGITVSLRTLQNWGPSDQEWVSIDAVLLRFNTVYTQKNARFPVHLNMSMPGVDWVWYVIGYDAAVCVQRYEPWIVETYNTSIASPSTLRIIGKGNASTPLSPSGSIQGAPIANTRYLNTTGKEGLIIDVHRTTILQMQTDIHNSSMDPYSSFPTVGPVAPLLQRLF